jgi:AcrR family transcriptional regulator
MNMGKSRKAVIPATYEDTEFFLRTKQQPVQQRAIDTFELILEVTARLLGEVGVERLSTNLICARAGLTPPALYRYFPNKYAILKELGSRLMGSLNRFYLSWLDEERQISLEDSRVTAVARVKKMQETINAITLSFPGASWILRAMRAVPLLQSVRLDSHELVATRSFEALRSRYPHAADDDLALALRLSTEVMYSATEMVVDNPHLDADRINTEISEMVVRYFDRFAEAEARYATSTSRES